MRLGILVVTCALLSEGVAASPNPTMGLNAQQIAEWRERAISAYRIDRSKILGEIKLDKNCFSAGRKDIGSQKKSYTTVTPEDGYQTKTYTTDENYVPTYYYVCKSQSPSHPIICANGGPFLVNLWEGEKVDYNEVKEINAHIRAGTCIRYSNP